MSDEPNSNRPKDHPLFQQKLRAWKPLMTFKDASIFFFVTGVIVLAIGIAVFVCDQNVQEYSVEYTDCMSTTIPNVTCASVNTSCTCELPLLVNKDMQPGVYFYYGLNNFYQNHRQLVKSFDPKQLLGASQTPDERACAPLHKNALGQFYAPCGQMPNVMFNDTFQLVRTSDNVVVPWTSVNTALESDKKRYGVQKGGFGNTVKPPNWPAPIYERYPRAYADDEELMVWMRPAALPKFRKLYRILYKNGSFTNGLPAGNYSIRINYNYPVKIFGGQKIFIATTLSWIGGKNAALGILYLATGSVEIVLGIILLALFIKYPAKKVKDNSMPLSTNL